MSAAGKDKLMIWQSIPLMTVIDILILGVVGYAAAGFLRGRGRRPGRGSEGGSLAIFGGLSLVALFYLADLLVMHAVPGFMPRAEAMAIMRDLHLNGSWLVALLGIGTICFGFTSVNRSTAALLDGLEAREVDLGRELAERKRVEGSLRESEERFRTVLDSLPSPVFLKDTEGRYLFINKAFEERFGLKFADMAGKTYEDLRFAEEAVARVHLAVEREVLETREAIERELPIRRADGTMGTGLVIRFPVFGAAGDLIGVGCAINTDITERKRTEANVRELNARFRAFLDNVPEAISLKDVNGRYLLANAEFERLVGLSGDEIHGKTDPELMPWAAEISTEIAAHERAVLESGTAITQERDNVLPDGSTQSWIVTKFPVLDVNGDVVAIGTTNTDITERKRAEANVRELNARFKAFLDNVPEAISLKDVNGRYLLANAEFERLVGLSGDEIDGKTDPELLPWEADIHSEVLAHERAVLESKSAIAQERDNVFPDGSVHSMIITKFPVLDVNGDVVAIGTTNTDITERKRAEEEVRDSRDRIRLIADNLPVAIAYFDAEQRFQFVNRTLAEWYSRPPDEILGRTIGGVVRHASYDRIKRWLELALAGEEQHYENVATYPDGKTRTVDVQYVPHIEESGTVRGCFALAQDITERKQAEAALRESEEFLRLVTDAVPALISYVDTDRRYRFVNKEYERRFGAAAQDTTGRKVEEILGPESYDRLKPYIDKALSGEAVTYIDDAVDRVGNRWCTLETRTPHIDESGRVQGIVTVAHDITQLKEAQDALHEREAQLSKAAEMAKLGYWGWDEVEDKAIYCSEEHAKIYGVASAEELTGLMSSHASELEWVHPEDRERYGQAVRDCGEKKLGYQIEYRIVRRDGETRYVHEVVEPIVDADGKITRSTGVTQDITESKRAEEALRQSEQRFKDIANTSADFFWERDENERFTYISDRYQRITGIDPKRFLGMTREDISKERNLPPEYEEEFRKVSSYVRVRKPYRDISLKVLLPGERVRYWRASGWPVFDDKGGFKGYRGATTDVTDEVTAEQARRESEALFRALVDNLPVEIAMRDTKGRYLLVNHAWEKAAGRRNEDVIGETLHDVFAKAEADLYMAQDCAVLAAGRVLDEEVEVPREGGAEFLHMIKFPIPDARGDIASIGAIVTNITQRKQAEAALRESEARLSNAAEMAKIGYWVWDEIEDKAVFCSGQKAKMYGVASGEALAAMLSSHAADLEWVHPEDRERYDQVIREARTLKCGCDIEYRIIDSKGKTRYLHDIEEPVLDAHGELIRSNGITQDITEQKRAEEQLRQAQKMEAVGQLTGGVAHDFNNVLGVILGNLELVDEELEPGNELKSYVATAVRGVKRGAELTQRLLAFSRKQALRPEPVDADKLVTSMTGLLRRALGETVEIEVMSEPGLWTCLADPGQLENSILNLAINARDAMPKGGKLAIETANVRLDDDDAAADGDLAPGDYVRLSVSDSGTGMAPEVIEHVFEPFFTTKDVGKGTGLGLSMVYGFAKQSGGHVTITSEEGRGTTVHLHLPRAESSTHQAEAPEAAQDPLAGGETVLVVEDDADVRRLVVRILSRLGYQVLEAGDGEQAFAVLEAWPRIDLLLSDVVLPGGMSGPEIVAEARRRRPGLKSLFMSGYAPGGMSHQGRLIDGTALLNKPVSKRDLAQMVRTVLDG